MYDIDNLYWVYIKWYFPISAELEGLHGDNWKLRIEQNFNCRLGNDIFILTHSWDV